MIVMDLKLDNIYSFNDFHLNMSYPKKIVNSNIEDEFLSDRPNFRYKKVNILMGSNATGKTTIGKALMAIFNFITKKNPVPLVDCISDKSKKASFSIDFVTNKMKLCQVKAIISPAESEIYKEENINLTVKSVAINKADSYEICVKKLDELKSQNVSYIEALNEIENFGWFFSYPIPESNIKTVKDLDKEAFRNILEIVLSTLDPSVQSVREGTDIEDTYIIKLNDHDLIIQDGKVLNDEMLSSGTKSGVDIAIMLTSILTKLHGFYYCDEKFSYIHSDLEVAILSVMINNLGKNEQLFFTTHNANILDMMLPKHSFVFLKKEQIDDESRIRCIYADDYLKRNTDSLRKAVENDLFSTAPNLSFLDRLNGIKN